MSTHETGPLRPNVAIHRDRKRAMPPVFWIFLIVARGVFADSGTVWATPHDSYSSSVGVLGCMINTNRIAYWPSSVSCSNICVSLTYGSRTVYLLKIDQSGGAYDVSYDAWNYLQTGLSASHAPIAGGAVAMTYEDVDPSHCADLIHTSDGRLPLSAANSMNYVAACLGDASSANDSDSWVGRNFVLFNILDSICTWGYAEKCSLEWPIANQASCPHTLGLTTALTTEPVYNIEYPSGRTVVAGSGAVVANATGESSARGEMGMSKGLAREMMASLPWLLGVPLVLGYVLGLLA